MSGNTLEEFPSSKGNTYTNFVRAYSEEKHETLPRPIPLQIRGEQAKKMYLEEVKDFKLDVLPTYVDESDTCVYKKVRKRKNNEIHVSNKDLCIAIQNDDIHTVRDALNESPERIDKLDEFGWSFLMMACQANSIETVKELLKRGAETAVRDKAGNSAQSLVIKNKNAQLATLLLDCKPKSHEEVKPKDHKKQRHKENFTCESCNAIYPDKEEHLASTIHNINASKGRKQLPCYKIPESNKGFQIMVKAGWDKESGLGTSGSGIKYPIKPVEKKDRKGLGHGKKKEEKQVVNIAEIKKSKLTHYDYDRNRSLEIKFRREFY